MPSAPAPRSAVRKPRAASPARSPDERWPVSRNCPCRRSPEQPPKACPSFAARRPSSSASHSSIQKKGFRFLPTAYCLLRTAFCPSDPAGIRVPDELVELQSHTHIQAIPKDPFGQLARGEPAEDRREDHFVHSAAEVVPLHKIPGRSEEHTSELQSLAYLVCRLLLDKKKRDDPK